MSPIKTVGKIKGIAMSDNASHVWIEDDRVGVASNNDIFDDAIYLLNPLSGGNFSDFDAHSVVLDGDKAFVGGQEFGDMAVMRFEIDPISGAEIDTVITSTMLPIGNDDNFNAVWLSQTKDTAYFIGIEDYALYIQSGTVSTISPMISVGVFPNPTSGPISIQTSDQVERVNVFNNLGQVVREFSGSSYITLDGLVNGIYILEVTTTEGIGRQQIIKQQ